jgi:LPPG:FO 2-phospho-L-lactate transferase
MSSIANQHQSSDLRVVLLAGGVGGAKLADGLAEILPAEMLTLIVNTGDDFEHLGLTICPDLDTVMYTLAGVANTETGWGRAGETWRTMGEISQMSGPDWFRLGDLDLATHLMRTHMLNEGANLTAVTRHLCQRFGISADVLPMSDQPAPTTVECDTGVLSFQTWFVKERWQPQVKKVLLPEAVKATPRAMAAIEEADVVVIAPSNPFVSIDPILNVYPIREMVTDLPQSVVAVSPIIGERAVKGPAAKMMVELGMTASAATVAEYYGDLIDGFVFDQRDEGKLDGLEVSQLCVDTWMHDRTDRIRLAGDVLAFAEALSRESQS